MPDKSCAEQGGKVSGEMSSWLSWNLNHLPELNCVPPSWDLAPTMDPSTPTFSKAHCRHIVLWYQCAWNWIADLHSTSCLLISDCCIALQARSGSLVNFCCTYAAMYRCDLLYNSSDRESMVHVHTGAISGHGLAARSLPACPFAQICAIS
jgi:hypothetical protein